MMLRNTALLRVVAAVSVVYGLPLPTGFLALNSTEGLALLSKNDTLRGPFDGAFIHHTTQQDKASCGRASAVIVLNGLASVGLVSPVDPTYDPYPYWTQDVYTADPCVSSNCTAPCTLAQAARALNCTSGLAVRAIEASELGERGLRSLVSEVCAAPPGLRSFMVANFDRGAVGMPGGGHFSPVAAFSPSKDMALVLDVAR